MDATTHALLVCLLSSVLTAQRTWVVDWAPGPGTDFTAIKDAVDVANDGDTILVRATPPFGDPAFHDYPAPVIDGKSIRLLGEGRATWITGPFVIRNLAASQVVTLSGFTRGWFTLDTNNLLDIDNCQGVVLLDSLDIVGRSRITNSNLVVASRCRIKQVAGFSVADSTLMVDQMTTDYTLLMGWGWPPIRGVRSKLWISNSTLRAQSCYLQSADVCILLENSDLWVGPNTTLIGGTRCFGGASAISDAWRSSTNTCSNYTIPPSRIRIDPTAQFIGTYNVGCQQITYGPQSAVWSTRTANTLNVEQRGAPLSVTVLALGPFDPIPVPGLLTPLTVDLNQSLLCMSSLPVGGALQWQFAIPPSLPPGFVIGIQAGTISPSGELSLSNASVFSIW